MGVGRGKEMCNSPSFGFWMGWDGTVHVVGEWKGDGWAGWRGSVFTVACTYQNSTLERHGWVWHKSCGPCSGSFRVGLATFDAIMSIQGARGPAIYRGRAVPPHDGLTSRLAWPRSWVSVHRLFGAGSAMGFWGGEMGGGRWGMGDGGPHLGLGVWVFGCLSCSECTLQRQAGTGLLGVVGGASCTLAVVPVHGHVHGGRMSLDLPRPGLGLPGAAGSADMFPGGRPSFLLQRRGAGRNPACSA